MHNVGKNKCNVDRPTERTKASDRRTRREREKRKKSEWAVTRRQQNSKYKMNIYKKSDEHRVNIVNVTLNHRHKKAKKHKEKKSSSSSQHTVPGQQINLRVSTEEKKKNHTVMERIADIYIKYGECLDSITQHCIRIHTSCVYKVSCCWCLMMMPMLFL